MTWLMGMLFLACCGGSGRDPAQNILQNIASKGPRSVLQDLYNKKSWPKVAAGISSGGKEWLDIYSALRPIADGEAGESLDDAIYEALPHTPFVVIDVLTVQTERSAREVCTVSFESFDPKDGPSSYLDRADAALKTAKTPRDMALARECAEGLDESRKTLK